MRVPFFKLKCSVNDVLIVDTAEAVRLHDTLLASMPEGARHDSDICPFCADKAFNESTASRNPPGPAGPDVSGHDSQHANTKGGTSETMSDISQETHEALLSKAVADATAATEKALATKTQEASDAAAKIEKLEQELAAAKSDNERLNGELDSAQVALKTAQDENASLKADIESKDAAAAKAEVASKRSEQVKGLGLFADEYVTEKAEIWADLSEEAWTERLEEWSKLKPASPEGKADTASAMSGTTEKLTDGGNTDEASETKKPSARRAVLGLPA